MLLMLTAAGAILSRRRHKQRAQTEPWPEHPPQTAAKTPLRYLW
jgi:hypothetical protein